MLKWDHRSCWNAQHLTYTFRIFKNPFYLTINKLSPFEFVNFLKHIQNILKAKWIWKHWGTFWKVSRLASEKARWLCSDCGRQGTQGVRSKIQTSTQNNPTLPQRKFHPIGICFVVWLEFRLVFQNPYVLLRKGWKSASLKWIQYIMLSLMKAVQTSFKLSYTSKVGNSHELLHKTILLIPPFSWNNVIFSVVCCAWQSPKSGSL